MANNKAARGLGEGLARVGEMLLADSLAKAREAALMKLRAEYDAPEREERKRQFEVETGQRDRQISLAEQEAKDQAAYRKKSLELEGRKVDAVASSKEAGKWQPIYEEQVVTDENGQSKTIKKQVGTFNELTNEHRYYMPDDAADILGDILKPSTEPANYVEPGAPANEVVPTQTQAPAPVKPQVGMLEDKPSVPAGPGARPNPFAPIVRGASAYSSAMSRGR